eukprot:c13083_g5_i1.p1 GENE.c13083_g5_i1~~c13083_g5_i1.p1  ORF type:complete len:573 (+),score=157.70 c13083_g5_i1:34-1719(+)
MATPMLKRTSSSDSDKGSTVHADSDNEIKELAAVAEKLREKQAKGAGGAAGALAIATEIHEQLSNVCKRLEFERQQKLKMADELEQLKKVMVVIKDHDEEYAPADEVTTELTKLQKQVDMTGWVMKESKYLKAWRRRYMVLRGSSLVYFDAPTQLEQQKAPRDVVALDADDTKLSVFRQTDPKDESRLVLCVEGGGRKLLFSTTNNEPSILTWRRALTSKIASLNLLRHMKKTNTIPNPQVLSVFTSPFQSTLEITDTAITAFEMESITPALAYHNHLTSLSLAHASLSDQEAAILAGMLYINRNITNLDLSRNNIGVVGVRVIVGALLGDGVKPVADQTQKDVSIFNTACDDTAAATANGGGVELLVLDQATSAISPSCLVSLDLNSNPLKDKGVVELCRILNHEAAPRISDLKLANTQMTPEGAIAFSRALLSRSQKSSASEIVPFPTVDVKGNSFDDASLNILAQALTPLQVTHLDLSHNSIGDSGLQSIARALVVQNCRLEHLDLSENPFSVSEALKIATPSIAQNMSLKHVALTSSIVLDESAIHTLRLVGLGLAL